MFVHLVEGSKLCVLVFSEALPMEHTSQSRKVNQINMNQQQTKKHTNKRV